jgi:hypothetical protein
MPDRSWERGKHLCFLTEIWCHSMTTPGTGVIRQGTVLRVQALGAAGKNDPPSP